MSASPPSDTLSSHLEKYAMYDDESDGFRTGPNFSFFPDTPGPLYRY